MRRLFLYTGIIIAISGITFGLKVSAQQKTPEKTYSVSLPISKWIEITNRLEAVKDVIRQSDIQARQSTFVCDSILTPLQLTIGQQVNMQMAAEKPQVKPDSTNKQKK